MRRSSSITLIGRSGGCRPLGNHRIRVTSTPGSISSFLLLTAAVMEAAVRGRALAPTFTAAVAIDWPGSAARLRTLKYLICWEKNSFGFSCGWNQFVERGN